MTDRVRCVVPFCRRTYKPTDHDPEEVMCGKHYRLASPILRRRMSRVRRIARKTMDMSKLRRLAVIDNSLWERVKKQAIEAAAGLR